MTFKSMLAAAAVSFVAVSASADVIEFDVSGLYMSDETGGGCCYTPLGTFRFDTVSYDVYDVSVSSPFEMYGVGVYDDDSQAFGLFSDGFEDADSTTPALVIDFDLELATILSEIAGGSAGDTYYFYVEPREYDNDSGGLYGMSNDPTLYAELISTAPAVPLPASMSLMLAGLAGLGVAARRKR